jgi:hypothetical protein
MLSVLALLASAGARQPASVDAKQSSSSGAETPCHLLVMKQCRHTACSLGAMSDTAASRDRRTRK